MVDASWGDYWKDTWEAMRVFENALYVVGNGWWPHANRHTDIGELIHATDEVSRGVFAVRGIIEGVADRAYHTSLTESHLEMLFGFDAEPFIVLYELGERLCDQFDATVGRAATRLKDELYEADDEEPEWWVAVNAAAKEATRATSAFLKEVKPFKHRLGKASEEGLEFFE